MEKLWHYATKEEIFEITSTFSLSEKLLEAFANLAPLSTLLALLIALSFSWRISTHGRQVNQPHLPLIF